MTGGFWFNIAKHVLESKFFKLIILFIVFTFFTFLMSIVILLYTGVELKFNLNENSFQLHKQQQEDHEIDKDFIENTYKIKELELEKQKLLEEVESCEKKQKKMSFVDVQKGFLISGVMVPIQNIYHITKIDQMQALEKQVTYILIERAIIANGVKNHIHNRRVDSEYLNDYVESIVVAIKQTCDKESTPEQTFELIRTIERYLINTASVT